MSSGTKLPKIKSKRGSMTGDYSTATTSLTNGNDESEMTVNPVHVQATGSQITRALAILPSLFTVTQMTSNDQQATVCNSIKQEEERRNSITKKSSKLFEILAPHWNSNSNNVQEQLKIATDQLIKFMKSNSDSDNKDYLIKQADTGDYKFKEIVDKQILDILAIFPRQSVPFDLILKTLTKIWVRVKTFLHRTIFDEISTWAISIVGRDFPDDFVILLDHIITSNFQFTTYQQAIRKGKSLFSSKDQVKFIINSLIQNLLEFNEDGDDFKFYGKFNIHFMELAINYEKFYSNLDFIQASCTNNHDLFPIVTPTLKLILRSTELLEIFNNNQLFDSSEFSRILSGLVDICAENVISPSMLIEQIQIILKLNQRAFDSFDVSDKIALTNSIVELVGNLVRTMNLFPEIPDKAIYALIVKGNFNHILILLIRTLNPIFTVKEFGFLLNLADELNPETPFDTLLTLLGSITIPRASWSCSDVFLKRSLRLHMYIETILSIQDQNISFDSDILCSSTRILGKSKIIEWKIPRAIDKDSYELITTVDLLVIPCLFIQRVLHRDYKKSKVIQKYLRSGKPNYRQFPRIINEILEDQCYSIDYQYPLVEILPIFPDRRPILDK